MNQENQNSENSQGETSAIVTPATPEKRVRAEKPVEGEAKTGKKKKKKVIEAKVDEANALAIVKTITDKKDLKYKYPTEVDDLGKRKKFRTEVRRKLASLEKEVSKIKRSNLPEDFKLLGKKETELAKYKKSVLVHPGE